jgi:hypothetical protein
MSQLKLITLAALFSLMLIGSASADPWVRYNRGHIRAFGPPIYAYPPVVVAPAPVIVSPHRAPVYFAPTPVVYGQPVYGYGVVGPRGRVRFGSVTPGFGVFVR